MSDVNVLFALKDSHFELLLDNFRTNPDGTRVRTDLTVAQADKLRNNYHGQWPLVVLVDTYHVLSFTLPEVYENRNDISAGHKWIEFLLNKWPNVWIVIGCWNRDGSHWGTTLSLVENGTDMIEGVEVPHFDRIITGTPVYPLHPQYMKIMPDVDGQPAVVPVDVSLVCGYAPRRWA